MSYLRLLQYINKLEMHTEKSGVTDLSSSIRVSLVVMVIEVLRGNHEAEKGLLEQKG